MEQLPPNNFWTLAEDPTTQKGKPNSSKWGRTKYKDFSFLYYKGFRDRDPFCGRSCKRREVSTQQESLSQVGSVGNDRISEGSITKKKKKEKKRKASAGSKWRLGEKVLVAASSLIRVRTVVKCPEDTLRVIMWHSLFKQWECLKEKQRTFLVGRL